MLCKKRQFVKRSRRYNLLQER